MIINKINCDNKTLCQCSSCHDRQDEEESPDSPCTPLSEETDWMESEKNKVSESPEGTEASVSAAPEAWDVNISDFSGRVKKGKKRSGIAIYKILFALLIN